MLTLTRWELLEACNDISKRYGGRHLGCVEGYRNQWLISVELDDTASDPMLQLARSFMTLAGHEREMAAIDAEIGETCWIRCGFCQTQIKRAPDGGFTLRMPHEVLELCRTREHVVQYFETWLGRAAERECKLAEWNAAIQAAAVQQENLRAAFRLTRETQQLQEVFGVPVSVVQPE